MKSKAYYLTTTREANLLHTKWEFAMQNIILYSTGCPKCTVLKKKLDASSIPYTVNDSVEDMTKLGISQVPVLSVDGDLLEFASANQWINQQGE